MRLMWHFSPCLMVLFLTGLAAPTPPCHPPWGNEVGLESPCFSPVLVQGDISVRQYTPYGVGYQQAFIQASFSGGNDPGDPTHYAAHLDEAVIRQLQYFGGNNSKGAVIARTSPILGRPNSSGEFFYDWMLPTVAFPKPARAPTPSATLNLQVRASTLGVKNLVASLHFTVTGVPGPGDFDQACDTLVPLLPAMGYKPTEGLWSPTYAYYTSRDFDGQHDGECLLEVVKA